MRTCVISQPRFFPGLHYLHRLMVADVFIVLDTVQYNPRHEENRARILGPNGKQWLTVPMRKDSREQLIIDTVIGDQPWKEKSLKTLQHIYGKAPHYADTIDEVEKVFEADHKTLVELDLHSWEPALNRLQPNTEIVLASALDVDTAGSRLLLDLCLEVEADVYLSGGFGRDYLDHKMFADAGVGLAFHEYNYPEYSQKSDEFVPFLSYLDVLFNVPLTRDLVEQGAVEDETGAQ